MEPRQFVDHPLGSMCSYSDIAWNNNNVSCVKTTIMVCMYYSILCTCIIMQNSFQYMQMHVHMK